MITSKRVRTEMRTVLRKQQENCWTFRIRPTCILYPDDYAAIGGINEIRERGLRIPEDISIAGYDGINIAKILEPKLTTLCQDTVVIGRIAAEKLIDLIENPKTTLIDRFTVDGTLFKGASVKQLLPDK